MKSIKTLKSQTASSILSKSTDLNPAKKLLHDYEISRIWYFMLSIGFYICIPYAIFFLFIAVASLISWLIPDSITVSGMLSWYVVVSALFVTPIFILRRSADTKFETAKRELISAITKGLQEEQSNVD